MSYEDDMKNITTGTKNATNFGALLLRLTLKADLHNLRLIEKAFPNAVKVAKHWRETGEYIDLPYE